MPSSPRGSFLSLSPQSRCQLRAGSVVKNPPADAGDIRLVQSLGWEDPLEEEMATHSSILALEMPGTEESGGLQPTGSQRVGHN